MNRGQRGVSDQDQRLVDGGKAFVNGTNSQYVNLNELDQGTSVNHLSLPKKDKKLEVDKLRVTAELIRLRDAKLRLERLEQAERFDGLKRRVADGKLVPVGTIQQFLADTANDDDDDYDSDYNYVNDSNPRITTLIPPPQHSKYAGYDSDLEISPPPRRVRAPPPHQLSAPPPKPKVQPKLTKEQKARAQQHQSLSKRIQHLEYVQAAYEAPEGTIIGAAAAPWTAYKLREPEEPYAGYVAVDTLLGAEDTAPYFDAVPSVTVSGSWFGNDGAKTPLSKIYTTPVKPIHGYYHPKGRSDREATEKLLAQNTQLLKKIKNAKSAYDHEAQLKQYKKSKSLVERRFPSKASTHASSSSSGSTSTTSESGGSANRQLQEGSSNNTSTWSILTTPNDVATKSFSLAFSRGGRIFNTFASAHPPPGISPHAYRTYWEKYKYQTNPKYLRKLHS